MTNSPTTDLLPCPFCSGAAEVERQGTARASMIVACTNCGGRMESGDVSGLTEPHQLAWNRRAIPVVDGGDEPTAWIVTNPDNGNTILWSQKSGPVEQAKEKYPNAIVTPLYDRALPAPSTQRTAGETDGDRTHDLVSRAVSLLQELVFYDHGFPVDLRDKYYNLRDSARQWLVDQADAALASPPHGKAERGVTEAPIAVKSALDCVVHALMVLPVPIDGQGKRAWASLLEAQSILEALSAPAPSTQRTAGETIGGALDARGLEAGCEAYNAFELGSDVDHVRKIITAYLDALASPPRESVTVKPLEWRPHIRRAGWFVADVPPGQYFVWELAGFGYWSHGSTVGREVLGGLDAAKDAAQRDYETRIRSALAQPEAPASLAEGWVLVPKDPTEFMIDNAEETMEERRNFGLRVYAIDVWNAILAAAPKPGSAS